MQTTHQWSVFKVGSAALLGAILSFGYNFWFNRVNLHRNYLCWRYAVTLISCLKEGPFDFVSEVEGIRYEGNTGNFIDSFILYHGAFERHILFFLRDTMTEVYSNQGVFVDVGANTGQHSLYLSRYASEVHAFEPWEPVVKRFRRMVHLNRIKNIVIHPVGLGERSLKMPFYKPPGWNLGTGSFVDGFKPDNSYAGDLEIQAGDDALEKAGLNSVAVIKIDIEGYEKFALRGLHRTLWKHRPIVAFELTVDPAATTTIKTREELVSLFPESYDFLVFSNTSDSAAGMYLLQSMDGAIRFDSKEQYDLVAYPMEKHILRAGPSN